MLKNYLKIALRNMRKYKIFSSLNIAGLAIGMTCTILILLWVQNELSYDQFHTNYNKIHRIIQDIHYSDRDTKWAITQGPLGPSLQKDFPEIIETTRIRRQAFRITYQEKSFRELVGMVDPAFLSIFSFPLLDGDKASVLKNPRSIVLSENMARKFFKDENPIGKTLKADNQFDFIVTGVMKNPPENSHLQFDFLIPFIFGRELNYSVDRWNNSGFYTYVMLQDGVSPKYVISKIKDYLDDKPTLEDNAKLTLQPLSRIHLYSDYDFDTPHGDIKYVIIFGMIGISILLIACFNFMNLSTARAGSRAKEIGMRKVTGAGKKDIILQFLGETLLISLIALVISMVLVDILLPIFNELAGKQLVFDFTSNPLILVGISIITLISGLLSGFYPALILSSLKPVNTIKGNIGQSIRWLSKQRSPLFRQILVIIQFSLSIILIIGAIVVFYQLNYLKNKNLGYEKESIFYIYMNRQTAEKFGTIKNELLKNHAIINVTTTANLPTRGYTFSNSLWDWDGREEGEEILFRNVYVDYDYFKTFKMEILQGRAFSKKFASDSLAVVINEAAVNAMDLASPVGKKLRYTRGDYVATIIGVVKDYNFRSLHNRIEPLVILFPPNYDRYLCVRYSTDDISKTIRFAEDIWIKYESEVPFDYYFLDESLDRLYRNEDQINSLVQYFTLLGIFVSCLGLLGLSSYSSEQRIKEMGIRKALGASVISLIRLFAFTFAKWVLVANLIAWPIAWYITDSWLQNFTYRIDLNIGIFIFAAGISLIIAFMTISFQAIKTALANPVETLRYE